MQISSFYKKTLEYISGYIFHPNLHTHFCDCYLGHFMGEKGYNINENEIILIEFCKQTEYPRFYDIDHETFANLVMSYPDRKLYL